MKIPLRWLAAYVDVELPPRALAERLTMSGSLVERLINTGSQWDAIIVGRVVALDRHPNADALWLATIDLGDRRQTVVTGADNLFVGALVPFIGIGSRLPGQEKPLEGRKLRGITSEGMVCSGYELGLNDNHSGILILDSSVLGERASSPDVVGMHLSDVLGEWIFELEITPNRPDCLAVYGIAREVAAVTGAPLRPPPIDLEESLPAITELTSVQVEAPDLCSRFVARVITGVTVGPSPSWMVERLQAAGMRSINNVVDVTNYVMLELGQPLHAYDLDTLAGEGLIVRRAREGERISTLDGIERHLTPEMLVIADHQRAVGIAGIMGGSNTEVHQTTTRILLEAATFQPLNVRRSSIALGLRSEASSRFEKGLPRPLAPLAADRAAALLAELTGGTVAQNAIDVGEGDPEPPQITFSIHEVPRLLGVDWPVERIVHNLEALGFSCRPLDSLHLDVSVPWWRNDVGEQADLVEEVARVTGFDAIPETLLRGSVPPQPSTAGQRWYAPARRILLSCGLNEGSSPGLTSLRALEMLQPEGTDDTWLSQAVPNPTAVEDAHATFQPVRVINPLTPEREYMRATLVPGLLEAVRDNLRAGEDRVTFFELDNCAFAHPGDLPFERRTLSLAMAGDRYPRSWATTAAQVDFFDLKGVIEELIRRLGLSTAQIVAAAHPLLHPGRGAVIELDGRALGFLGELHPMIAERWDLGNRRAYIAEFDFDALAARATDARPFTDYPRLPVAKRDLAVVVDESRPAEAILEVIRQAGRGLLAQVTLFDVYRGEPLEQGQKSLAFAVDLQAPDRTLTEDEVEKVMGRIRNALAHQVGARFRT